MSTVVATANTLNALVPTNRPRPTVRTESTAQYQITRDIDAEFALMLEKSLRSEDPSTLQRFTDADDFRRFLERA
jgi:hypothetical protein